MTSSAYSRSPPTGRPLASRVTREPERLQQRRHVHGGRVALEVRVRGEDHLGDVVTIDAVQELLHAQIVGADAVERADRAAQHVVAALDHAGLLDGGGVLRLLDHAERGDVAAGVATDPAEVAIGDVAALPAEGDALLRLHDHLREPLRVLGRSLHEPEGEPLRRLGPHAG